MLRAKMGGLVRTISCRFPVISRLSRFFPVSGGRKFAVFHTGDKQRLLTKYLITIEFRQSSSGFNLSNSVFAAIFSSSREICGLRNRQKMACCRGQVTKA
jgi:hypothetical protein